MVVEMARARHGDTLAYLEGDFHEVESFGGPYELILLCNIVHGEAPHANEALVQRAAASLAPGGRLLLRDMFLDELGSAPSRAVFFGLTMLFYTDEGRSPSLQEARDWLCGAGLSEISLIVQKSHQMLIGRRPG
jgi:hypothetical protein